MMNYGFLLCIVFLEDIKIEANSCASVITDRAIISSSKLNVNANSIQNSDSSASSITILSFATNAALDCANRVAR